MASHFVQFSSQAANPQLPGVVDIEPQDLLAHKTEVEIVDVRRPDEFTGELGHVPGAQMIVLDTLPQHLGELSKDRTLVFVCRSGARSARAAAFAKDNGFTSVFNLKGGMLLWNQLGLETDGKQEIY